jgi:hypothetical protein
MGTEDHLKFKTNGKFLMVNLHLENVGSQPIELRNDWGYDLQAQLVDDAGRRFAPFDVGYLLDNLCESIKLNPGLGFVCQVPYEVPMETLVEELNLLITLETEDEETQEVLIDLTP